MNNFVVDEILPLISAKNPMHAKKLKKVLLSMDQEYAITSELFYKNFFEIIALQGKGKEFAIDCYLRMCNDMVYEQLRFMETGCYSNTSFEEVNKNVYDNPEVMEYHMMGLLMSQFLWHHHYKVFSFFKTSIDKYASQINNYLEIGGGHGLYTSEIVKKIPGASIDIVDISESSIKLSKQFVNSPKVKYFHQDIFEYHPGQQYDFITMGEVLEHVEDPLSLLKKLRELLKDTGSAFITTPANAPTIDHIYLFRNVSEIRELIREAGMIPHEEYFTYVEDVDEDYAVRNKVPLMYSAFIKKLN
jgi:2-polyprenyl-3-methyl-5-hydroxy-6-metoxy-1,4-benzoquinol methylase